jgi:hypothetical protein
MSDQELEVKALADYKSLLGKTILVSELCGYRDNDSGDIFLDPPVRFQVDKTPQCDIVRWADSEWLDPIYQLHPVEDSRQLDGWRSFWIHGKSYSIKGKVEESRFTVAPSLLDRICKSVFG